MFDLIDGVLQLLVEIAAVGDDDDRVEDGTVLSVVDAGELMGEVGDGVGFAGASAVLDEVVAASAFVFGIGD